MSEIINFTVKSLNGDTYKMTERDSSTVSSVMSKVSTLSGGKHRVENVRLILAGKDLSSDSDKNRSLADVGLMEKSTIFLVVRLDGGKSSEEASCK